MASKAKTDATPSLFDAEEPIGRGPCRTRVPAADRARRGLEGGTCRRGPPTLLERVAPIRRRGARSAHHLSASRGRLQRLSLHAARRREGLSAGSGSLSRRGSGPWALLLGPARRTPAGVAEEHLQGTPGRPRHFAAQTWLPCLVGETGSAHAQCLPDGAGRDSRTRTRARGGRSSRTRHSAR